MTNLSYIYICQLNPWEQTSAKFESKYKTLVHEKTFEKVVCEIAAILFRERWVNDNDKTKPLKHKAQQNWVHIS